jgi:hypothetical protein
MNATDLMSRLDLKRRVSSDCIPELNHIIYVVSSRIVTIKISFLSFFKILNCPIYVALLI